MSLGGPDMELARPLGEPLKLDTLPPADTGRWIARKKAQVVTSIRGGLISKQEACKRYSLSNAELFAWEQLLDSHGLQGLQATKIKEYGRNLSVDMVADSDD